MTSKTRLPRLATALVALAVAAMVTLGFWQLGRLEEKRALIAQYRASLAEPSPVAWPRQPEDHATALFRRSRVTCERVEGFEAIAGRSARGQTGWAHLARCALGDGGRAVVAIGWSRDPAAPQWRGGEVRGWIAPHGDSIRLVAEQPVAGLEPLARPDPSSVPNNHLAYAVQWFVFAALAVLIYALALRRRRVAAR